MRSYNSNVLSALRASEEKMRANGSTLLGAFVSEDIHGKVRREEARQVFIRQGFREIARTEIPSVTPEQALRKACTMQKAPGGLTVSEFQNPSNSRLSYGVYFKPSDENADASEAGDKLVCGARVRVDPVKNLVEFLPPEGQSEGNAHCMGHARNLANKAQNLVDFAETSDITGALGKVLEQMFALKLSQHGRGHIILTQYVGKWTALLDALSIFGVRGRTLSIWDLPDHRRKRARRRGILSSGRSRIFASVARRWRARRGRISAVPARMLCPRPWSSALSLSTMQSFTGQCLGICARVLRRMLSPFVRW